METPIFDKEGYPTEETLSAIKKWRFNDKEGLIKFIANAWYYEDSVEETYPGVWVFATGGWSGNENLIYALEENEHHIWLGLSLQHIHLAGGLYIIAVNDEGKEKLEELKNLIRDWAWDKK